MQARTTQLLNHSRSDGSTRQEGRLGLWACMHTPAGPCVQATACRLLNLTLPLIFASRAAAMSHRLAASPCPPLPIAYPSLDLRPRMKCMYYVSPCTCAGYTVACSITAPLISACRPWPSPSTCTASPPTRCLSHAPPHPPAPGPPRPLAGREVVDVGRELCNRWFAASGRPQVALRCERKAAWRVSEQPIVLAA